MNSAQDVFAALFVTTVVVVLASGISYTHGVEAGRIQVASGQWTCELVANPDKTTEWVCKEAKK